jgi:hypothetical protein
VHFVGLLLHISYLCSTGKLLVRVRSLHFFWPVVLLLFIRHYEWLFCLVVLISLVSVRLSCRISMLPLARGFQFLWCLCLCWTENTNTVTYDKRFLCYLELWILFTKGKKTEVWYNFPLPYKRLTVSNHETIQTGKWVRPVYIINAFWLNDATKITR